MGGNSDGDIEVTDEERNVMKECVKEAFWYRCLPASTLTGFSVNYAIKTGKIRSYRYGGWPIILGASSLAYVASKISYILGKHCQDKFLEMAPNSEMSEHIKKDRAEVKAKWRTEHDEQLNKFSDILDQIDLDTISDVEKRIIQDCNSTAFWKFSLPLMLSSSGAVYLAIKKGFLNSSKWNTTFPKAPKMVIGGTLGYIAGQYLYVYSKDCSNRFLQYAPSEKIARLLRHDKTLLLEENFEEFSTDTDNDGYIIADYGRETIDKNIKETCGV